MKTTVYIATSLDGFIAREDGSIDWLPPIGGDDGEDYGYAEFFASIDALVMGRNTYELVRSFGGDWPYGSKPIVVLTTRGIAIPDEIAGTVEAMAGSPADIVTRLEQRGWQHLYIDGGITVQQFLNAGLIQRMIITSVPVLIGKGIPLFGPVPHDIRLRHVATRSYATGLVQNEYEVVPAPETAASVQEEMISK
jgi:dihydrofolate reductase